MGKVEAASRTMRAAEPGMEALGPLKELPGIWKNVDKDRNFEGLAGRGWNLIALPFGSGQLRSSTISCVDEPV